MFRKIPGFEILYLDEDVMLVIIEAFSNESQSFLARCWQSRPKYALLFSQIFDIRGVLMHTEALKGCAIGVQSVLGTVV